MSDHGTTAAMWRHRKRKEVLCDECRPLWNAYMADHKARKKARPTDTANTHCRAMDEALEKQPPTIVWAKNSRGVFVAVEIDDPHAERPSSPVRNERQRAVYAARKESAA